MKAPIFLFWIVLNAFTLSAQQFADADKVKARYMALKKITAAIENPVLLNDKDSFLLHFPTWKRTTDTIGFGAYVTQFNYEMYSVSVAHFEHKVMQCYFRISPLEERKDIIEYIRRKDTVLSRKMSEREFVLSANSIKYTNHLVYNRYKNKVADSIGVAAWRPFIQNKIYRANYELLCDPVHRYEYGQFCGPGGSGPVEGANGIGFFKRSRDTNAIRSLMQGFNPEGRIYAIEALTNGQNRMRITENDRGIIRRVLRLDTKLRICEGCFMLRRNALYLKRQYLAEELF